MARLTSAKTRENPLQTAPDVAARLLGDLVGWPDFQGTCTALDEGREATIDGVWGSAQALVVAGLEQCSSEMLVVVTASNDALDDLGDDLRFFSPLPSRRFPAWEADVSGDMLPDEIFSERLRCLETLRGNAPPRTVVTSIASLLQPVPPPEVLASFQRTISVGDELDLEELLVWLTEHGFHRTTAVELPSEFALRGGILDIFVPGDTHPLRVEFFGDQVESLRHFDVGTQRSLETRDHAVLGNLPPADTRRAHFFDYVPQDARCVLLDPPRLEEAARQFLHGSDNGDRLFSLEEIWRHVAQRPSVSLTGLAGGSGEFHCQLPIESVERFRLHPQTAAEELDAADQGEEIFLLCQNEAERQRVAEMLGETVVAQEGRLQLPLGSLREGFRFLPSRAVLLTSNQLFHTQERVRRAARQPGRAIDSFLDLRPKDLIVHLSHGIGRFHGIKLLAKADHEEEHLELEFHGGTRIFVPASKIGLVQKYVGGAKSRPSLAKIGGKSWFRQKLAAQRSVTDLAADLLEVQARRASRPGIEFPEDSEWMREFEASFPYRETPDQLAALRAIKHDMVQPRPMDRLLCGDVGYGKTEVAMRAAFKAVDAGYQVSVMVPTTVLAEQHRRTFSQRMAEFPFSIATLSRLCSAREERRILEGLASGEIDVVIGTHRLAQPDIRFRNLGLLVIDEEQRFGVEIKERLKAIRTTVDVLTMTATPIPRTLHLSLLGVRDISNLETPPEERVPVETKVTRYQPELIRHALLRELNRNGQAYFVHNRVHDIENVAHALRQIVPEAEIRIAHGQMAAGELESVMLDLVQHKFDVLLATTIIENGLDIPQANTIFINECHRYGLADLHQLRGRVGRYKHRGYCYLLLEPHRQLSTVAEKRLRAIEEFSQLGAGFAIAMRDLEIRGAGNILGTEQSGHIATVGYELYCELLEQAVRRLRNLPPEETIHVHLHLPGKAYFPRSYVPDARQKIELYRRLERLASQPRLEEFVEELRDRFGTPPDPVLRMLRFAEARILANAWKISSIYREDEFLVLRYRRADLIRELAGKSDRTVRIVDTSHAYVPLNDGEDQGDGLLELAISLLRKPPA